MGVAMNRRNFLSSLLALIPLPFLTRRERPSVRKNPEEAFKEALGKAIEAEFLYSRTMTEIDGKDFYIATTGGTYAMQG